MKFRMIYTPFEGKKEDIKISDDEVLLNDKSIDCSKEERINTLISLFSCAEKWDVNDIANPRYDLYFESKGIVRKYCFDINMPYNWLIFNAYINRLVRR